MVDMNALERQLADESLRIVGPARPVDDLAVYESVIAANRQRGWGFTMFSALKVVAAGVIVALFGGFLLAGILTTPQGDEVAPAAITESPSPMTTEELLSGMVTEEVEPGVFLVLNDGVRDLTSHDNIDVVAGYDGGIWLLRPQDFHRLGADGSQAWPTEQPEVADFEVAPDGTVWTMLADDQGRHLYSVGSGSDDWTLATSDAPYYHVEVTSDGTVWALWRDDPRHGGVFGYFGTDGWESVGEIPSEYSGSVYLLVSDRGEVWAIDQSVDASREAQRFVDGAWRSYDGLDGTQGTARDIAVGADGTVWGRTSRDVFFRFDGTQWLTYEVPVGFSTDLRVAQDGSVWFGLLDAGSVCGGVGTFDGRTWSGHLPDLCIGAIDIAADGSVWVIADDDLYVITPEAVTPTEADVTEPAPVEEATGREDLATTEELLSGMVTEEVEPEVYRVINDGVRDIASASNFEIVAGQDGGIWLLRQDSFLRLATPSSYRWANERADEQSFEVAPDGSVWMGNLEGVRSFQNGSWTAPQRLEPWTIAPDGTIWAIVGDSVARLGSDGWERLEASPPEGVQRIFVTQNGEIWLAEAWLGRWLGLDDEGALQADAEGSLWRYDEEDRAWQEVAVDAVNFRPSIPAIEVGLDGTVWFAGTEPDMAEGELVLDADGITMLGDSVLMRLDESGWQRWGSADGVPSLTSLAESDFPVWHDLQQAPDGALWLSLGRSGNPPPGGEGLSRFDGSSWQRYLAGHLIDSIAVDPDGSTWVLAREQLRRTSPFELFVIIPEAVAATE